MTGSPLYAAVCRRLADASIVDEIAPDQRWDIPARLLGALHYIVLAEGVDPWAEPEVAIVERRDWIAEFLATQRVQTNEVQRAWALLPAFLSLGASRLDLLELGPSAGLNLVWDRYRYRYQFGSWGPVDAALELAGDEREPVPGGLLERSRSMSYGGAVSTSNLSTRRPRKAHACCGASCGPTSRRAWRGLAEPLLRFGSTRRR